MAVKNGETITYKGGCDVIRTAGYGWAEFGGDNKELIIGKKYEVINALCNQRVYIKKDGQFIADDSQTRYLSYWIMNEQNQKISIWEGFFEENSNL